MTRMINSSVENIFLLTLDVSRLNEERLQNTRLKHRDNFVEVFLKGELVACQVKIKQLIPGGKSTSLRGGSRDQIVEQSTRH